MENPSPQKICDFVLIRVILGGGAGCAPLNPPLRLGGLGSVVSYPSGVQGGAQEANAFHAFETKIHAFLEILNNLVSRYIQQQVHTYSLFFMFYYYSKL